MRKHICHIHCRYFKPGKKEVPGCGGVEWLEKLPELAEAVRGLTPGDKNSLSGLDEEDPRLKAICAGCEFMVDGCDFRDSLVPRSKCSPCGGLIVLAALLKAGEDVGL